jgi:hypothetical protein
VCAVASTEHVLRQTAELNHSVNPPEDNPNASMIIEWGSKDLVDSFDESLREDSEEAREMLMNCFDESLRDESNAAHKNLKDCRDESLREELNKSIKTSKNHPNDTLRVELERSIETPIQHPNDSLRVELVASNKSLSDEVDKPIIQAKSSESKTQLGPRIFETSETEPISQVKSLKSDHICAVDMSSSEQEDLSDLESEYVIVGVKTDDKSPKIVLSVKKRSSLYDPNVVIWDTAASVHIFRNLHMFSGAPTPVDDKDVSFVGFDTSSGNTLVVSKGVLKHPFEGIEAFYSPSCIGNIVSEAKFRQEFHVYDRRSLNYKHDTMISDRIKGRGRGARIHWARGAEDIFVANLSANTAETLISVQSPTLAMNLSESEVIVEDWLVKLGLSSRETLGSLSFGKLSKSVRMGVIRACMIRLRMSEDHMKYALDLYASASAKVSSSKLPILDVLNSVIDSLRVMSINDSLTTSKRGRVVDYASDGESVASSLTIPGKDAVGSSYKRKSLESRNGDDFCNSISSEASASNQPSSSSSGTDTVIRCHESSVSVYSDSSKAARKTNAESTSSRVSISNSATIDGLKQRKNLSEEANVKSSGEESGAGTQDSADAMVALWLYNSELSVQELMVALLISEFGLTKEPEIVLLSLEQQGLSKAAIQRIATVERLHKKTSFIGLRTLALMIQFRSVKDLEELTVEDVKNYHRYVHETDCACVEGKMKVHSAPDFDNVHYSPNACFCDIMQLTTADKVVKFHFLIAIDAQSQFIFCLYLAKLNNTAVGIALKKLIGLYRKKATKAKLAQIILDNAGSLISDATKAVIVSCDLDPKYVTPGEHVKIAEAGVKVVKSLCRTTVLDSANKKKFVTAFVPYLMDWVVGSINYSLRTGSDHASPYTRFTNNLVSAKVHFKAAFLDIVAVNDIQDKTHNLQSRARVGLVLARDESERGALILLDIDSGQLMKRTHIHLVEGVSYLDRVKTFLSSGKYKHMKTFDAIVLEKFHKPSDDFDMTIEEYNASVSLATSLDDSEDLNVFNPEYSMQEVPNDPGSVNTEPMQTELSSESSVIATSVTNLKPSDEGIVGKSKKKKKKPAIVRNINLPQSVFKLSNDDAFAITTDRDGACLFLAVAWFFKENSGNSAAELRDEVCNFIQFNAHEPLPEFGMSILDVLKADISDLELAILSDEVIIDDYVSALRRESEWGNALEIAVLEHILKISIVVFQPTETGFYVVQRSEIKHPGLKVTAVPLVRVGDNHYESLNIIRQSDRQKLRQSLPMSDEEGDVSLPNFLYDKCFGTTNEVVMASLCSRAPRNDLTSNMCVDELEEDYKVRKLLALLTISEPSSKSSEGVSSLKQRRPAELEKAQVNEVNQVHEREVWQFLFPKEVTKEMLDKLIPLIMLNKEKCFSDGVFDKVKARLVALGCRQQLMEDELKEAPTASIQSFYLIIMLAAKLNIKLRSKDVTGAFLHADLNEDEKEYVLISKKHVDLLMRKHKEVAEYRRKDGSIIAKLKKCLYGLKQSPQRWYDTIRAILEGIGMQATTGDKCLFYELKDEKKNYLLLFVDDMLIAFQSEKLLKRLSDALNKAFGEITDQVGPVLSFLGITITQTDEEITLDQAGFINKLVGSLKLNKIHKYSNPAASDFSVYKERYLKPQTEADPALLTLMRRLTMSVMYCALRTRRDVLFLASFLASIKCPNKDDIEAIKRVIMYLATTIDKKQHFYAAGAIMLILFGDASHNAFVDGKGQGSEIIYADENSAALDMNSNKLKGMTDSSCESEIIVQSSLGQRGIFFYNQLCQLGIIVPLPMIMYCDNEAAVTLANRKEIHVLGRTKYFNRLIWKIHEAVSSNMVKPTWIASKEMDSDMGTKALMGSNFDRVSNRSFSRLHPKLEVKLSEYVDPWRSEITVVKGSVKAGSSGDIPKSSVMEEVLPITIINSADIRIVLLLCNCIQTQARKMNLLSRRSVE